MKICVITYGDFYFRTVLKVFESSKRDYCSRHNYTFISEDVDRDVSYKLGWEKVKLAKKYIKDYDIVYMTDFDSVIVNAAIKIEDLVHEYDDIVVSTLEDGFKLLGGSIWVKTENTIRLLDSLCNFPFDNEFLAEETALDKLDTSMYNIHLNNTVNCIYGIHEYENPLLLHFAGIQNPYKIKREYEQTQDKTRGHRDTQSTSE